jgi:hypothetical protein
MSGEEAGKGGAWSARIRRVEGVRRERERRGQHGWTASTARGRGGQRVGVGMINASHRIASSSRMYACIP